MKNKKEIENKTAVKETVKGYKVFNPDWSCRDKQYTCPGKFEESVVPDVCNKGMHFCKRVADCFNYYEFDPQNKVAVSVLIVEHNQGVTDVASVVKGSNRLNNKKKIK